jgi:hypothetical protein
MLEQSEGGTTTPAEVSTMAVLRDRESRASRIPNLKKPKKLQR